MRLVVLGLSLSSSWGNGHATTYRALLRAFARRGHDVVFLERDLPWYADNRDLLQPDFCRLGIYAELRDLAKWRAEIAAADAVIVGSCVPRGVAVGDYVLEHARGVTAFYDIDTPVTLAALRRGDCEYVDRRQVAKYDLYLSFTGGPTLDRIELEFGARAAGALYCSADPDRYAPARAETRFDLAYLGTYSADRQPKLESLLIETARRAPALRFVVAGAQYPDDLEWPQNVERIEHVAPAEHPAFYGSCRFTLNVTREEMVRAGFSPSVRLFEAAACATAIVSDEWDGIDTIFRPGSEILLARDASDVLSILRTQTEHQRLRLAAAARRRVLREHSADQRAEELEKHLVVAAFAKRRLALAPRDSRENVPLLPAAARSR